MSASRSGRKSSAATGAADDHNSKKFKPNSEAKEATGSSSPASTSSGASNHQEQESESIAEKERALTATAAPASPNQSSGAGAHRSDGDAPEAQAGDLQARRDPKQQPLAPASDPKGVLSRDQVRVDHIASLKDLPIKHVCNDRACFVDFKVLGREQLSSGHLLFYIADGSARTFINAEPACAVTATDQLPIGSVRLITCPLLSDLAHITRPSSDG